MREAVMKKVYIATGLANFKAHNEVRDLLAENGIGLTYDWTYHGNLSDSSLESRRLTAEKEVNGVISSDAVVVLLPGGRGTHVEIGIGFGCSRPIFLYEENGDFSSEHGTCIFYWHPGVIRVSGGLNILVNRVKGYLNG